MTSCFEFNNNSLHEKDILNHEKNNTIYYSFNNTLFNQNNIIEIASNFEKVNNYINLVESIFLAITSLKREDINYFYFSNHKTLNYFSENIIGKNHFQEKMSYDPTYPIFSCCISTESLSKLDIDYSCSLNHLKELVLENKSLDFLFFHKIACYIKTNLNEEPVLIGEIDFTQFNGDISEWDFKNCISLNSCFYHSKFNKHPLNINSPNLTDICYLFADSEYNQDLTISTQNLKRCKFVFTNPSLLKNDIKLDFTFSKDLTTNSHFIYDENVLEQSDNILFYFNDKNVKSPISIPNFNIHLNHDNQLFFPLKLNNLSFDFSSLPFFESLSNTQKLIFCDLVNHDLSINVSKFRQYFENLLFCSATKTNASQKMHFYFLHLLLTDIIANKHYQLDSFLNIGFHVIQPLLKKLPSIKSKHKERYQKCLELFCLLFKNNLKDSKFREKDFFEQINQDFFNETNFINIFNNYYYFNYCFLSNSAVNL